MGEGSNGRKMFWEVDTMEGWCINGKMIIAIFTFGIQLGIGFI